MCSENSREHKAMVFTQNLDSFKKSSRMFMFMQMKGSSQHNSRLLDFQPGKLPVALSRMTEGTTTHIMTQYHPVQLDSSPPKQTQSTGRAVSSKNKRNKENSRPPSKFQVNRTPKSSKLLRQASVFRHNASTHQNHKESITATCCRGLRESPKITTVFTVPAETLKSFYTKPASVSAIPPSPVMDNKQLSAQTVKDFSAPSVCKITSTCSAAPKILQRSLSTGSQQPEPAMYLQVSTTICSLPQPSVKLWRRSSPSLPDLRSPLSNNASTDLSPCGALQLSITSAAVPPSSGTETPPQRQNCQQLVPRDDQSSGIAVESERSPAREVLGAGISNTSSDDQHSSGHPQAAPCSHSEASPVIVSTKTGCENEKTQNTETTHILSSALSDSEPSEKEDPVTAESDNSPCSENCDTALSVTPSVSAPSPPSPKQDSSQVTLAPTSNLQLHVSTSAVCDKEVITSSTESISSFSAECTSSLPSDEKPATSETHKSTFREEKEAEENSLINSNSPTDHQPSPTQSALSPDCTDDERAREEAQLRYRRHKCLLSKMKTLRQLINDTSEKTDVALEEIQALKQKAERAFKKNDVRTVIMTKMSINVLKSIIKEAQSNQQKFYEMYKTLHEETIANRSHQVNYRATANSSARVVGRI